MPSKKPIRVNLDIGILCQRAGADFHPKIITRSNNRLNLINGRQQDLFANRR